MTETPASTGHSRVHRAILLAPGVVLVLVALLADYIAWYPPLQPKFGLVRSVVLAAALVALVCGYLLPRVLPPRYIQAIVPPLFACGVFLALFAVVDFGFRLVDPFGLRYYPETERYVYEMVDDDDFKYIHRSGLKEVFQGVDVSINGEGFRWNDLPSEKTEGQRRLLVLGDSIVFGWGAEQDKLFPAVLQNSFRENNQKWEVVAAGVGSWNTRTEFEWLRKRGMDYYHPDVLLLVIVSNDVELKAGGARIATVDSAKRNARNKSLFRRIFRPLWNGLARTSYLCGYVQHLRSTGASQASFNRLFSEDSPEWQDAEKALREMHALCQKNNVLMLATLVDTHGNPAFEKRYTTSLDELKIPFTKLPFTGGHTNSIVDGHPDKDGHRMLADHLAEFLKPYLP